jgi:hypothetical protein
MHGIPLAGDRKGSNTNKDRRIITCRLSAIRRARCRYFRGAKGDFNFRGGPKVTDMHGGRNAGAWVDDVHHPVISISALTRSRNSRPVAGYEDHSGSDETGLAGSLPGTGPAIFRSN